MSCLSFAILSGEKNFVQNLCASSFHVVILATGSEYNHSSSLSHSVCGKSLNLIASSEIPCSFCDKGTHFDVIMNLRILSIQDIVNACAIETINVIIKDVGDSIFSILVDESCDVSMKEQMSIILRYVDNSRHANERLIGIEHITSTTALSLKAAIDKVFSRYNLSISRLRGQGYDGASNMQGKFNGLKTLILKESPCAFYIHCFVHQLQLALVAVAKKNIPITNFFRVVGNVINTVGASSKRCDLLREKQLDFIVEALEKCDILSGRGLNQETTLQRSGETRWSSYYNSLVSLLAIFSFVLDVLAVIVEDESCSCDRRSDATNLLELIRRFDFTFNLQLMRSVLGISNKLSKALQRKDQDIVNAMQLVRLCKR
ncbi:zinc finger MYM-type protein 1-like [Olea europaea var. sylvestris]|uniref:zinc finger MYM-type protein 1-like n=1 Tax=Olea europaea var. sylvestris TaxID=158386 RepID=UPI000C1D8827|nr:zinc finger MYM-type protein 1-like [Olea europaea var. sylvestris]